MLDSDFYINEPATSGQAVALDTALANTVTVASGTMPVIGLLAQDVTQSGPTFVLGSVSPLAKVGDKVGVYMGPGHFLTDQLSSSCNIGDLLYLDPNNPGQLTNIQPSGGVAVARATSASGAVSETVFGTVYTLTRIYFFGGH